MKKNTTIPGFFWVVLVTAMVASCAAPKSYEAFADWDASRNSTVERNEFVQGYTASNYFGAWAELKRSVTYDELAHGVFRLLDRNGDANLSHGEFTAQTGLFYFGLFHDRFDAWDDDNDGTVNRGEFDEHITVAQFAMTWDVNGDKLISGRELAGGMFYVSDANSDGVVTETELRAWKSSRIFVIPFRTK